MSCDPVVIGPGKTSVPLVFEAAADAPIGHGRITITGTATIDGHPVSRIARGGGLTWPTVNTPGIARMADGVAIAVREAPPFVVTAQPATTEVHPGDKLPIAVTIARAGDWNAPVQLSGFDLPNNATVALVNVAAGATQGKVEVGARGQPEAGHLHLHPQRSGPGPPRLFRPARPGQAPGQQPPGDHALEPDHHHRFPGGQAREITSGR